MSQETEQIKDRLNIAEVVGEYVPLKQAGQNLKGLCPFHQEKTPSFIVSPARNTWHCFGCGEGGDIFSFIQKIEGLDFPAALKMLADRAGVQLPKMASGSSNRRQRLFEAMAAAAHFYHQILVNPKAGKKARDYLHERGVTADSIKRFNIGYAPAQWNVLQEWLAGKGFSSEEILAAGLMGRSTRGKTYDIFRGRIIFPVTDLQNRIIAMGGRIVPWHETGNEGKYVNSPETALYEKSRTVYNLGQAKKSLRDQPCLVVEGYMDVVMLVQSGIENVVATSGTAFTEGHVDQIRRFTNSLHFAFDADAAGFKATVAATTAALEAGMKVATIVMPAGHDPADLARKQPEKLTEIFTKPQSLVSVLLQQLRDGQGEDSQEKQLAALLPLVARVNNPIEQGVMRQEMADILHVSESTIVNAMSQLEAKSVRQIAPSKTAATPLSSGDTIAQQRLLGLMILDSQVRQDIFQYLEEDFLLDQKCRTLYKFMQRLSEGQPDFLSMSSDQLVSSLPAEEIPFAEAVKTRTEEFLTTCGHTILHEARLLLRSLQRRSLKERLAQIQNQLLSAGADKRSEALHKFQTLAEELASVDKA